MARKTVAKPATKSATTTAKKKAPAKRRAAPAKATTAAKRAPAAKTPAIETPAIETPAVETPAVAAAAESAIAPAPKAAPTPKTTAVPATTMARVEFSNKAAADNYKAMSKAAFDAYLKSGNLFAENFGVLNREIMAFAQATMESSLETARAMTAAGSLKEVVDLQAKHSQKSVDSFLAESAKLTEMSVEMANGSIEPLQNNLKVAVEKLWKPIAA
ncbi:MAG TPA: phasin family protein [Kiloniellaceae bacterium]|nr:phasin family protein [Kiloniellaceae bacterium]